MAAKMQEVSERPVSKFHCKSADGAGLVHLNDSKWFAYGQNKDHNRGKKDDKVTEQVAAKTAKNEELGMGLPLPAGKCNNSLCCSERKLVLK